MVPCWFANQSAADANRSRSHSPASAARPVIKSRPDTATRSISTNAANTSGAHGNGTFRGSRPPTNARTGSTADKMSAAMSHVGETELVFEAM